jgi:Cu(I)/Ag(I) efflux system membrane fusion protein
MRLLRNAAWLVLVASSAVACESKPAETKAEKPAAPVTSPAPAATTAAPSVETKGDISAALRSVLDDYEGIRKGLAADETKGVAEAAKKIAAGASGAETSASDALKPKLGALAKAATALADEKGDIEAVRLAFGELSKALVDVLTTDDALRKDLHLFECPMAKGYKKWVQPNDKLENPYMGKKMLTCGGKTDWKV